MSMNGVDYTKKYASDREYFQDANKKLQEITEKRIEDTESRAEHVMNKQRQNFIEDRAELEKDYQAKLNHLKEKTQASLESNSKIFNEDLLKERQEFTQDSVSKSRDFDQRLNSIKSSYQKSLDSEKNRNVIQQRSDRNKYDRNMSEIKKTFDKKLDDYNQTLSGTGADLREQNEAQRMQLVEAQENRLSEAYQNAANNIGSLKERIHYENKKVREAHRAEKDQQKEYMQERMSTMHNKYQERSDALSKDYTERNKSLTRQQQEANRRMNLDNQEHVAKIRHDYNEKLRKIELSNRKRDNGSGDFAEIQEKQQGLNERIVTENKIKHLRDQLSTAQVNYQRRTEKDQQAFNHSYKEANAEANVNLEKKINEINSDKIVTIAKQKDRAEKDSLNREQQFNIEKNRYESLLMNEKNSSKLRIDRLKEKFNDSVVLMEEKHKKSMEEINQNTHQDKAEFIKSVNEKRAEEVFDMKRAFTKMMDMTVQDYEQQLALFQRENDNIKTALNQRIEDISEKYEKQLDTERAAFKDRHEADFKSQQVLMDERESELKKNISQLSINYQRKIDKMIVENETKLKLITNEYETKLQDERTLSNKEKSQKDSLHMGEVTRLKENFEKEKRRLVNTYEGQIETIRNSHKQQLNQINDYKRLS